MYNSRLVLNQPLNDVPVECEICLHQEPALSRLQPTLLTRVVVSLVLIIVDITVLDVLVLILVLTIVVQADQRWTDSVTLTIIVCKVEYLHRNHTSYLPVGDNLFYMRWTLASTTSTTLASSTTSVLLPSY
jgi:hypothetical protein